MSAFVGKPWGRYVYVRAYSRQRKNGGLKFVPSHLRRWPGTKATLYFSY
jgi:hypothetical protein